MVIGRPNLTEKWVREKMTTTKTGIIDFLEGRISVAQFDNFFAAQAQGRQIELTKPAGSLGKLEELAVWMAGWQKKAKPTMMNPHCLIFAGNHGVAQKGVSAYPSEVTGQMVENFKSGGAAINQLCQLANLTLSVHPIDLKKPTRDFSEATAMDNSETLLAMQLGFQSVPNNCDFLVLGEMGIGNTTAATAIACALFKGSVKNWTGFGTGLDSEGLLRKISVIESGLALHGNSFSSVESILSAYGGREMAAIAGSVIAARIRGIPVLLDGFICTAAAATLTLFNSKFLDHCLISHLSSEPGHIGVIKKLQKEPIIDLSLRLGEGSGAAVSSLIIRAALATHNGMSTFSEAGVSEKG